MPRKDRFAEGAANSASTEAKGPRRVADWKCPTQRGRALATAVPANGGANNSSRPVVVAVRNRGQRRCPNNICITT
jgi:hypothetical protein